MCACPSFCVRVFVRSCVSLFPMPLSVHFFCPIPSACVTVCMCVCVHACARVGMYVCTPCVCARRCKTSLVGQSAGLSIPRSSVCFRQKLKKPRNSNLHVFELHRPSSKGTKLLFQVIKAIINQSKTLAKRWAKIHFFHE